MEMAGTLRHRFTFKLPSETAGDAVITETLVVTVWGENLGLGGSETGFAVQGEYRIRIRYRTNLNQRMVFYDETGRRFQVISITDPTGRKRELIVAGAEIQ